MALKDMLVSVDRTRAGAARLRLALGLARSNGAHLVAVYPLPEPAGLVPPGPEFAPAAPPGMVAPGPIAGPMTGPAASESVREAEHAEAAERLFESELRANGIAGEWHLLGDRDIAELIEFAKTVDLAILGQLDQERRVEGAAQFSPQDVIMGAGRPVLVIPYAGTFATVGRRVLIAWDGSREAGRAINDAMPLIAGAEAVTVMLVAAQQAEFDGMRGAFEHMLRHLRHHGIDAEPEEAPRGDMAVSDVLLSRAADLGIDLIVAGAYHHSPLREAVLGGVSRELLAHMTVPVLLSH
jgi:nucleotide-binding universal stress UspA family protein